MLVSGIQQSDSVNRYIFSDSFPLKILQDIEYSYMCYTVNPCCLFILYIVVCICRRQWQPTPVLLPGRSHGRRSLVGCSSWDCKESDMTERLHFHFSLSCIGEGNGNPLQCSCLENPRDGGAWWAAVYGVTQSRTRLKRLSSSSSSGVPLLGASPDGASGKESACQCRRTKRLGFDPWVWKIPWRMKWPPTPVFLPEKSHGPRSLAGYGP